MFTVWEINQMYYYSREGVLMNSREKAEASAKYLA